MSFLESLLNYPIFLFVDFNVPNLRYSVNNKDVIIINHYIKLYELQLNDI